SAIVQQPLSGSAARNPCAATPRRFPTSNLGAANRSRNRRTWNPRRNRWRSSRPRGGRSRANCHGNHDHRTLLNSADGLNSKLLERFRIPSDYAWPSRWTRQTIKVAEAWVDMEDVPYSFIQMIQTTHGIPEN